MKIKYRTKGLRHEVSDYFDKCLTKTEALTVNKVIALVPTDDGIEITQVNTLDTMNWLPPETQCIGLWPGKLRSDYFEFTVETYLRYKKLKKGD